MIYSIFPTKDTTLYEATPTQNTGYDNILELVKVTDLDDEINNSRIIMKFDLDDIPTAATAVNAKYYLNMYVSEIDNIPISYEIDAHPLATQANSASATATGDEWEVGTGRQHNYPIITVGSSWRYTDSVSEASTWFLTGSVYSAATYSYHSSSDEVGGGVWFTSSIASQSFDFESGDIRMDITEMVNSWQSGSIPNHGLILKRTETAETDDNEMGNIKFYSRDTHTIFPPKLEICWDDSEFETGSLSELISGSTSIDEVLLYPKSLRSEYKELTKTKVRLVGRQRFPTRTYSTTSAYLDVNYLPSASYYSILDMASSEIVVPFDDDYTKISCDANGNYLNLWTNGLQAERYYKFIFKVIDTDGNEEFFQNDFYFKVVR